MSRLATDLPRETPPTCHAWTDQPGPTRSGPFAVSDAFGRRLPRRMGLPDYLLMVAKIDPSRVRRVPLAAIAEDGVDDLGDYSLVACPCGARPTVRTALARCSGCERYYVAVEMTVWVTYGAMTPPPLPSPSPLNRGRARAKEPVDVTRLDCSRARAAGDPGARAEGSPVSKAEGTGAGS